MRECAERGTFALQGTGPRRRDTPSAQGFNEPTATLWAGRVHFVLPPQPPSCLNTRAHACAPTTDDERCLMATYPVRVAQPYWPLHPLHLLLVCSAFPLFLGALLADIAYARSYEIQWTNFASWLVTGALVFAVAGLVCGLLSLLAPVARTRARLIHVGLLALTCVLGLVNALIHAMDAWQKMPQALVWSGLCVLSIGATLWFAFGCSLRRREGVA